MRIVILLVAFPLFLSAQFGVSGMYNFNNASPRKEGLVAPEYTNGPELALHYWFRLPKYRVEFLPTVYATSTLDDDAWREVGLQFKTNIYLFDLGTDCDCPTFGKQGPQLDKGFFLQLSPGVSVIDRNVTGADAGTSIHPNIGAAVGIDFGLSNLVTLTPIAGLRRTLTPIDAVVVDDDLVEGGADFDSEFNLTSYQLGLQLTLRLDKRRY